MSIIAILVALATTSYSAAQKKARDARREEDMSAIQKAAEQYYMLSSSNYPPQLVCSQGNAWVSASGQTVLEAFPKDPKTGGDYIANCGGASYCVCAALENKTGNSSGSGCTFTGVGGTGWWFCVKNQQ